MTCTLEQQNSVEFSRKMVWIFRQPLTPRVVIKCRPVLGLLDIGDLGKGMELDTVHYKLPLNGGVD